MEFIAFDLETTGTLPGVDAIVEVGAVHFNRDGEPAYAFSTLVDPRRPMPADATRVNGIRDDMLKGKPTIEDVLPVFTDFCNECPLVAHNAPFDFQFLVADYKKHGFTAPKGLVLDTFALSKKVYPGLANYRLGTLVQHLKIPSTEFHRAEEDASYCGLLFSDILKRLATEDGKPSIETLIRLGGKGELRFPLIELAPKQLNLPQFTV